jgi:predicted metal-dependent hydrolase
VSKKSARIAEMIIHLSGRKHDPHYLGYFECFNQQLYYEAHDVLEELWLPRRNTPNDHFFKGLIQLAGAFVHLQKERLRPSAALFKLAQANLLKYPALHEDLDTAGVLSLIELWMVRLESGEFKSNPLHQFPPPTLALAHS